MALAAKANSIRNGVPIMESKRMLSYVFLTPILVYAYMGAAWAGLIVAGYGGWSFAFHPDTLFPFEILGLSASFLAFRRLRR